MIDYLTQVKPLEDAGKSDAEIVAALQSDPRYKRDIMATGSISPATSPDLLHLLAADFEVLRLSSDATWKGPLVDYFADPNVNQQLKAGFELLLTQLQISNRPVFTHSNPKTGALCTALTTIVGVLHGDAKYVQSRMDSITGGRIYAEVTEQTIVDSRAEYHRQQTQSEWATLQNDGINQSVANGDRAALVKSLRAAADSLEGV